MPQRKSLGDKEKTMGTLNNKVFILHGWTYSTEKWNPFIKLLKKRGLESCMLHVPGLTEKTDKAWNIEDYVEWLNEIINKEKSKVFLISHSNGGRIALNFAIKYPQKLEHLILIASAGIYHDELSIKIKRLVFGSAAKIGKKLSSSERLRNLLYKIVREDDYENATPAMRQTMVNLINSDKNLCKHLEKIKIPTLIIWGRNDKVTPLSDGELMHKLIKNSTFTIIKDARHSPQFTNAREVTELIYEYI